jgi:hypothetical protein
MLYTISHLILLEYIVFSLLFIRLYHFILVYHEILLVLIYYHVRPKSYLTVFMLLNAGTPSSKIRSINRRRRNFTTAPRTEWMTTDQNKLGNLMLLQKVNNKLCMSISSAIIRQYVADKFSVYDGRFILLFYHSIMMTLAPLIT